MKQLLKALSGSKRQKRLCRVVSFGQLPAEYRCKEGRCYVESRKRPGILISATTLFHICTSWSRQLCRITAFHEVMNINSCQFRIPLYPQKPSDIAVSPFKQFFFSRSLNFFLIFLHMLQFGLLFCNSYLFDYCLFLKTWWNWIWNWKSNLIGRFLQYLIFNMYNNIFIQYKN